MKYLIILGDGMSDYAIEKLNNKTPLDVANKPFIDNLTKRGEVGLCKTVPDGLKPGSDVANLSVIGYDPKKYYTGRSPLEAASIGIDLSNTDVTLRANLVTLSDEEVFQDKTMVDYSAGEISTKEATDLINYLKPFVDDKIKSLYSGVSYRHCLVIKDGKTGAELTPPHDITGKKITNYLPKGVLSEFYFDLIKTSYNLLKDHPINLERIKRGKNPANSLWFWGEGTKPKLDSFYDKFNKTGVMISAVDLLKGIGKLTGLDNVDVDGATGNYETNFMGKANATVNALLSGKDFVYLHMEAPDECGHQGDLEHKIYSIEQIDKVVETICTRLDENNLDYRILIMPDHPTPIAIKTHVSDPVPYLIFDSTKDISNGAIKYSEKEALKTGAFENIGHNLINKLFN